MSGAAGDAASGWLVFLHVCWQHTSTAMAVGKWFLKLGVSTPPLDAARLVLESRARVVAHYLRSLVVRRNEHPEQIHQLRVATRRFGAALSIFRDFFRTSDYQNLRNLTRAARRAAGTARDLDVHRELIETRIRDSGQANVELVRICDATLSRRRQSAQEHLLKVVRGVAADFTGAVKRSLAHLDPPRTNGKHAANNLGSMARKMLHGRLKALRRAARGNMQDWDSLHGLRIAAKRLRYAMEVFAGCFPISFRRQLYRAVERIQEEVGHINDLRNLVGTIQCMEADLNCSDHVSKNTQRLLRKLQNQARSEARSHRTQFLRRWNRKTQRAFHRRVKSALSRPLGTVKK